VLLIISSPVVVIVAILLAFFQKGQVLFTQLRPGKNEQLFKVIKFKTMTDQCDVDGNLLPDEKRLTWIGKLIRKTSLDELPQLINILNGEMSFIGPRPWLVEYLTLYNEEQRKRHDVKPGITGWAQVNGRNMLSWEDRFEYDLYYVQNQSFLLDMKIIFLTIFKVFKADGVSQEGHATMDKFRGNF